MIITIPMMINMMSTRQFVLRMITVGLSLATLLALGAAWTSTHHLF
jgi:hypothetical protein